MTDPRRFGKYSKVIRELEDTIQALCRQMERIAAEKEKPMTDEQIKHMVDRFLGWKLPGDFNPDGGISFKKTFNDHMPQPMKNEPIGTNLLDATQADAMVRYLIEGMPDDAQAAPDYFEVAGKLGAALVQIASMDPKECRADDLGRAARIAREALAPSVSSTHQSAPVQPARVPKVRTSHHRNKEEAARLQTLVAKRYARVSEPCGHPDCEFPKCDCETPSVTSTHQGTGK